MTAVKKILALGIVLYTACLCASEIQNNTASPSVEQKSEKHGYWWYEDPPKPVEETQNDDKRESYRDLAAPPPEEELERMHPKQVEAMIKEYRQYALWKMTPEHVKWYFDLQNYATKRSSAFANVASLVALQHPEMTMDNAYPANPAGRTAYVAQRNEDMNERLENEKDRAALVMFKKKGCPYCAEQRTVLKYFESEHYWDVKEVDINEHPEMASRFNITMTPTTIVILKEEQNWMPIGVGVQTLADLEEKTYRVLRYLHGETSPEQFNLRSFEHGTIMDPKSSVTN